MDTEEQNTYQKGQGAGGVLPARSAEHAAPRPVIARIVVIAALAGLLFLSVVAVRWRASSVGRIAPADAESTDSDTKLSTPQDHPDGVRRRPRLGVARAPSSAAAGQSTETGDRARFLLNALRFKTINDVQMQHEGLETAGNAMEPYLTGALTTLKVINPAAIIEMKEALADQLCRSKPTDLELMLTAKMVLVDPGLSSQRLFDCVLPGRGEDVVLWTLLDAWRASGSPRSDALAEVQARATDPRTRRRFSVEDPLRDGDDAVRAAALASVERQEPVQLRNNPSRP